MDQVLHAHDSELAQVIFHQLVVRKGDALFVNLAISSLVDQFSDGFKVGVAVGDVGVDNGQHLCGRFGESDENAIVDLEKAEELEDLARLGRDLVDTRTRSEADLRWEGRACLPLDANNKHQLVLGFDIEGSILLAQSAQADFFSLCVPIFFDV